MVCSKRPFLLVLGPPEENVLNIKCSDKRYFPTSGVY